MGIPRKHLQPTSPTLLLNIGYEGDVFTYAVGEPVIFGELCHFSSTSYILSDNTQVRSVVIMCLENKSSGQPCKFLCEGFVKNDSWSWTPGGYLWIGSVPGSITDVMPSGGVIAQCIGYALTPTLIHFMPTTVVNNSVSSIEASTAAGQMLFGDGSAGWDRSETSELFWDDVDKRIGIGTATTGARLDVRDNGTTASSIVDFHVDDQALWAMRIFNDTYGTSANNPFRYWMSNAGLFQFLAPKELAFNVNDNETIGSGLYLTTNYRLGVANNAPAAKVDALSTSEANFRATHTFGSVYSEWITLSTGIAQFTTTGNGFQFGIDNKKIYLGAGSDMSTYYDGTSGYIKTDEVAASDLHLTTGVGKTIVYDTPVYDDLNFDPRNGGPVATRPDDVTINNVFHVEFTSANNQLCGASMELPHTYKLGTDLTPHVHIFLKSGEIAGTIGVKFTFYWELRQLTGTTSGSLILMATPAELETTAGANNLIISGAAFAGSAELGGQLAVTIARTGGDAGDVVVSSYGIHHQIDTPGSRTETTK